MTVPGRIAIGRLHIAVRLALVLAGFTLLTVLFFWPWLAHLSTALIGPPEDNMQDFWNSWHAASAQSWKDLLFTRQIRFPEGTSLAYHSFAWPQIAAVALLSRLFGGDFATIVALHNLTLLASFPLAAAAMFYLARHMLGASPGRDFGALVAGFVFAFNPWHVAQAMHHAHVSGIEFLPLFVLFYFLAQERKSPAWLAGAAAMQALSALSSWYFFFYTLYFLLFHLVSLRLGEGKWPRGRMLAAPALCTGLAVLLLSPWLAAMAAPGSQSSIYYPGHNTFVADLLALVAFPPTHLLAQYGSGIYAAMTSNSWEGAVYLGLANLAFLTWALMRKKDNPSDRKALNYALAGMIFFAVIAGGEALHVGGHVTPLHLPGVILAKLPLFANVRTPARAIVFSYLFLALALAQASVMALRYRGTGARAGLALIASLMLLDFVPVHLSTTPAMCPRALAGIATEPGAFGVLDLPGGYSESNAAMMLSACHGHAIVLGETSRHTSFSLADRLQTRDLAEQKRQLTAAHVKYIVLHRQQGELFRWTKADGDFTGYASTYQTVQGSDGVTILRVY
jgi:hypothetical protein